jgi:hypothetical protein
MPVYGPEDDDYPTTPPAGAYAAQADLVGVVNPIPATADLLLVRASRAIDRALLTAVYDRTDPVMIAALKAATVEQLAGTLAGGDKQGLGVATAPPQSFTIGRLAVQKPAAATSAPTTGGIVDQAWSILQAAGLTGHAPLEAW